MAKTLDGPRVPPAHRGPARQLVVLLHGYGADGNDLIALAPSWQRLLPDAAFVSPNAPDTIPGMPFGRQWFDLSAYDPNMLRRDPHHLGAIYQAMFDGAARAATPLDAFLDAELRRLGLGPDRLALVGFSQGTMMALQVGLRRAPAPIAIVGFSGALLGADQLAAEKKGAPPILLVHGDADEIVPVEALFQAVNALGAAELPVRFHVSRGLGHGIDEEGLILAGRFLADAFKKT
jgi:phospholipase/carboxylesterase